MGGVTTLITSAMIMLDKTRPDAATPASSAPVPGPVDKGT